MRSLSVFPAVVGFLFLQTTYAATTFNMEDSFSNSISIPSDVLARVVKEFDLEHYGCGGDPQTLFEAANIQLSISPKREALVVKPRTVCLCAAQACPYWIFENQTTHYRLVGRFEAHTIRLREKVNHGYRQIIASSGTAGWTYRALWRFDGKRYKMAWREDKHYDDDSPERIFGIYTRQISACGAPGAANGPVSCTLIFGDKLEIAPGIALDTPAPNSVYVSFSAHFDMGKGDHLCAYSGHGTWSKGKVILQPAESPLNPQRTNATCRLALSVSKGIVRVLDRGQQCRMSLCSSTHRLDGITFTKERLQ
jgi:hypothetical protein